MLTVQKITELAEAGQFWWYRDGEFFATESAEPAPDSAVYILDASPQWLSQWGGDYQACADQINPLIEAQLPLLLGGGE